MILKLILAGFAIYAIVSFVRSYSNQSRIPANAEYEDNPRSCAYGDATAYEWLTHKTPEAVAKDLFASLHSDDWAARYFYCCAGSRLLDVSKLFAEIEQHPDNADLHLLYGARLVQWGWEARGYGRGHEIGEDNWRECHRRLELASGVLEKAAELNPADPTPWAYQIIIATWTGEGISQRQAYFEEAKRRDPENWAAHQLMIIGLSEKWSGSHAQMYQFAREAAANAPAGSDIPAVLLKAHIEYAKYLALFQENQAAEEAFRNETATQEESVAVWEKSLGHPDHKDTKATIFARYNASAWLWAIRKQGPLRHELTALGNRMEDIHWRWAHAEGDLADAWAFAEQENPYLS